MGVREDLNEVKDTIKEIRKENEENSFAMELLKGYKTANRRLFTIILVILAMWFMTIGYLVYILNDYEYSETSEIIDIDEVDTIDDSTIKIGE